MNSYDESIELIKTEFWEVFKSCSGKCYATVMKIPIVKDAVQRFYKRRPVSFALRDNIEKQLDNVVEEGIIEPINDSEYGTSIITISKIDDEIKTCGDYETFCSRF